MALEPAVRLRGHAAAFKMQQRVRDRRLTLEQSGHFGVVFKALALVFIEAPSLCVVPVVCEAESTCSSGPNIFVARKNSLVTRAIRFDLDPVGMSS